MYTLLMVLQNGVWPEKEQSAYAFFFFGLLLLCLCVFMDWLRMQNCSLSINIMNDEMDEMKRTAFFPRYLALLFIVRGLMVLALETLYDVYESFGFPFSVDHANAQSLFSKQ